MDIFPSFNPLKKGSSEKKKSIFLSERVVLLSHYFRKTNTSTTWQQALTSWTTSMLTEQGEWDSTYPRGHITSCNLGCCDQQIRPSMSNDLS
jgi:hypothetical protein